jgi:transposase
MAQTRRVYTDEFKQDAIRLVTEQGYNAAEAARNLGINANMLRRWQRRFEAQEQAPFGVNGKGAAEQEELERLRRENQRLRMEREILKKTVTFFANQSR